MSNAQFSFQDDSPVGGTRKGRRGQGGGNSVGGTETTDNSSVAGSLTYSATSSVQSNGSAAGESTDSSFADILRAIDNNDAEATELANLTAKVGVSSVGAANGNGPPVQIEARRGRNGSHKSVGSHHHNHHSHAQPGHGRGTSSNSIASSLQYSEDGESYAQMHPAVLAQQQRQQYHGQAHHQVPQTITGQPSDSSAPDLGGLGGEIHFAPAHQDPQQQSRQRSDRSVVSSASQRGQHYRHQQAQYSQDTRPQHQSGHRNHYQRAKSDSSVVSAGSGRSRDSRSSHHRKSKPSSLSPSSTPTHNRRGSGGTNPGTPPTSPPPRAKRKEEIVNETGGGGEAWYSQWWMCGFSDALTKFGVDPK